MVMSRWGGYHYATVLHANAEGHWAGIADDDGSPSLLGGRPSVIVIDGRVTMTRRQREISERSQVSEASFDGGEALNALLREGDWLACWRDLTGDLGLSVSRAGSFVLGLGALGCAPARGITIDHDPRVEERQLAREIRYIDRPGTHIVWLDPDRPNDLETQLRKLEGALPGVSVLAIVVRTDDTAVSLELNRRTMQGHRPDLGARVFLRASKRFSDVEDWLKYGRALSTERPPDLSLRIRTAESECLVPEGTTAAVDGWLVHVRRVYEC